MRYLLVVMLLCSLAYAKDKRHYQDAVLVSFKTVTTGQSCQGSASTQKSNDLKTEANASCQDTTGAFYTVAEGGHELVLRPRMRFLNRASVLSGLLPGTHLQISSDSKAVYVKVGDKESKFDLVEAK